MLSELQFSSIEILRIGFRGGREEQLTAIALCRRYDGLVLLREGDSMLIEVVGDSLVINDLLSRIPSTGVTHLWRSTDAIAANVFRETNFCRL